MALVCGGGSARATEIYQYGTNVATTVTYRGGGLFSQSYTTLGSPVTFNSLGFIDVPNNPSNFYQTWYGNDGLVGSYVLQISLFSAPETILASTTVGPSSTLIEYFRYSSIPATTIPANTKFNISAVLPEGPLPDAWLDAAGVVLNTINFGPVLVNNGNINNAFVNASTTVVAPEPTTTATLLLALGCLATFRQRRR